MKKEHIQEVLDILASLYPGAECELNFQSRFQLLVAVVLSAQTTDIKVNQVTKVLFEAYPDLDTMLEIKEETLMEYLKYLGLYKMKTKHVMGLCKKLKEDFNGEIPSTLEELTSLPGVGRKTANVVMSNGFGIPAIAVDTHVFRVSNRIGLAKAKDVLETEKQLMKVIPKDLWSDTHHRLILHGRRVCKARSPLCESCTLNHVCQTYIKTNKKKSKNV